MDGLDLTWIEPESQPATATWVLLLNAYALYFGIAFTVTLLVTPIVRRIAIATGVVDQPDRVRKLHAMPVAYLGGVAVLIGLLAAIGASYVMLDPVTGQYDAVPIAVLVGMLAIGVTGLADDIWKWDPRLKIAGQLVAAAALATQDIGVDLVKGAVMPVASWLLGSDDLVLTISSAVPVVGGLQIDVAYWASTAILAMLVLGACNGANLI
ncbi:MAG: hypothetical protein KDA22_04760, partial [Phycisphaerales bacterium]|nr:hypothetical protein [Phycisphaerales bacterium]